ncbi:MAG: hypothetical protein JWP66_1044 [Naasia sp.]|nr:hypothetical protein [Naasia sp.]
MTNPQTPDYQPAESAPSVAMQSYAQPSGIAPPPPGAFATIPDAGPRGGRQFAFDGGASTYIGTALLALLITVVTLGICYPFALVLRERWRAKHSFIDGQQMAFNGSGFGLFGLWIKWFLLIIITLGIYSLWVGPRIARWKWEHTGFAGPVHAQRHG